MWCVGRGEGGETARRGRMKGQQYNWLGLLQIDAECHIH